MYRGPTGSAVHELGGLFAATFATHSPMAKRIAILKGMGYAQVKREGGMVG